MEPQQPPTRWLKATEVAARLGVHKVTVYRWAREGVLPCVTVGTVVRFPEDALERWMREQAAGSGRDPN